MPITTQHPQYVDNIDQWNKIDDFIKGGDYAKQYIAEINRCAIIGTADYDPEMAAINRLYREGAIYINYLDQTTTAIVGLATNQDPIEFTIPPELEYIKKNATGDGLDFIQLLQTLCRQQLLKGRVGLIAEYPKVELGLSGEEVKKRNLRPFLCAFKAQQITNWKVVTNDIGQQKLQMLTIYFTEEVTDDNDRFSHECTDRYLVLEMFDGKYSQITLDRDGEPKSERFFPMRNGKYWDYIPIDIIGSENNNIDVDKSPMATILELSQGHMRNSAIYEDNLRKYGRGTLYMTAGMDIKDAKQHLLNRRLVIGGEYGYYLGTSGNIGICQLEPAQEAAVAMKDKVVNIMQAGGHIVQPTPSNVAYDTLRLNMGASLSTIETVVNNLEAAINNQLNNMCDYLGIAPNVVYKMSREFIKIVADPAMMAAFQAQFVGGCIPRSMVNDYNRKVDLTTLTDDEIDAAIEAEGGNDVPDYGFDPNQPVNPALLNAPVPPVIDPKEGK